VALRNRHNRRRRDQRLRQARGRAYTEIWDTAVNGRRARPVERRDIGVGDNVANVREYADERQPCSALLRTSDDYNGTPNTGWTQSTGMEQQTFHGGYIWWQVSTGAQPPSYTIGSASGSSWVLEEWSGLTSTPYDISNGAFTQTTVLTSGTQATPTITPTSGDRLLLAMMGASNPNDMTAATGSFNNSFSVGGTSGNNIGATTGTGSDVRQPLRHG
jgi:type VI protein secretion system component VasK